MAECEHQFKAIGEAQKTFLVVEMPKDIKREFLTGPRKFDEFMEKLEIIINEMMADDGPVPMDSGSVGTRDTRMTQSDSDTSNDMSYDNMCVRSHGKGTEQGRKQARNDRTDWRCGIVDKELMNGRVAEKMTEGRRARRAANLTGTVTGTKEALETKAKARAKARARAKPDIAMIAEKKGISE